jgi:hypothetical protein
MKLNYFTELPLFFNTFPQYTNVIFLILAQFLYSLLRKIQLLTLSTAFLQCSRCLLVPLSQQSKLVAQSGYDVTPLQLSTSLTNTATDRHLLSNLPAINVRKIQIPFTIEYDTTENNTKQTNETHTNIADNAMCDSTSQCNYPYLL